MYGPESRKKANERERKNTQKMNECYQKLRSILPKTQSNTLSKIGTLRLAADYISYLHGILEDGGCGLQPEEVNPSGSVGEASGSSVSFDASQLQPEDFQSHAFGKGSISKP